MKNTFFFGVCFSLAAWLFLLDSNVFGAVPQENPSEGGSGAQDNLGEPELYELMDSPAIRNLVSASTFAANRAVDNAMDALFYSLLDKTWPVSKTRFSVLETGIERKLTKLPTKAYLVIDRVMIGPTLTRDLLPPSPLGVSTKLSTGVYFYEFYLASDAERLTATKLNYSNQFSPANWFGLLPLLSKILPPSFDPNELYNPLRTFSAPLKVPLNSKDLQEMPSNSIRSYAIKGTIGFPLSHTWLLERLPIIAETTGLHAGTPIDFYANAEARVSVQKRSDNEYRISLSNIKTEGLSLGFEIGKTFYAFGVAMGKFSWRGLPVPIAPLKLASVRQLFQEHTEIRDINLSYKIPEDILARALTGNFLDLDRYCHACVPTVTSREGSTVTSSRGASSFFFDTNRDSIHEFGNHTMQSKDIDVAYRESRFERKSLNWNIMNGAITNEAIFSWSTPTRRHNPAPLLWGKFSLIFPQIDEQSLLEIKTLLNSFSFLPKTKNFDTISHQVRAQFREKQSLETMKSRPPLEPFRRIFSGPQVVGDFELTFDIYAEESGLKSLAKMPTEEISRILNLGRDSNADLSLNALCHQSIISEFLPADGLDICRPNENSFQALSELQSQILNAGTQDEKKRAASTFIAEIGVLGFIELVNKTQPADQFSIYVKSVCRPRSAHPNLLSDFCKGDSDGVLQKNGKMDSEKFAWWLAKDTPDPLTVSSNEGSLSVLKLEKPPKIFVDTFIEVLLSESIATPLFVFLRIESKGRLDVARTLIFEDILQLNTDMIEKNRVVIPRSMFRDSDAGIADMKLEDLRITVNVSRDKKTWSAIKILEN
ncbi:MAG: hypothetical protein WCI18_07620 [Pseudomonadota bacterium]